MNIAATEISECKECGSTDLRWFASMRSHGFCQDGRLRLNETTCDFVLGCNHCSGTLAVVSVDQLAAQMTERQGKRTVNARCISMRPGMGEVTLKVERGVPSFMDPGLTVSVTEA